MDAHPELEKNPQVIEALKQLFLTGEEARLPSNIGFFIMWFGVAEMYLTRILAFVLDIDNMAKFELLAKGMDARVKCERFRKATKRFLPAGPLLLKELTRFEQKSIALRNRIAHSWPVLHEETVYFTHVGTGGFDEENIIKDGTEIAFDELFKEGLWLNAFANRLSRAFTSAIHQGLLEIVENDSHPRSEDH